VPAWPPPDDDYVEIALKIPSGEFGALTDVSVAGAKYKNRCLSARCSRWTPDVGFFLSAVANKLAMDLVGAGPSDVSTWNRGALDLAVAPAAHGPGCAGRGGCWRFHPDGMLRIFWREGRRTFSCGPASRIRARRALGCSLEVSTPIQQDRSVRLFQRGSPDVWIWGWLTVETERLGPGGWSGAVGCFTWKPDGLVDTTNRQGRSDVPRGTTSGGRPPAKPLSRPKLRNGPTVSADVKVGAGA